MQTGRSVARRLEVDVDEDREVVGRRLRRVDPNRADPVRQHAADEAVVEPALDEAAVHLAGMGMQRRLGVEA